EEVLDDAAAVVRDEMRRFARDLGDVDDVEEQAARSLRRFFAKRFHRRPQVVAMAIPVGGAR
ncbi:MAG: hypothetical protein AAGH15_19705, partial [Myxococcota bacterium]